MNGIVVLEGADSSGKTTLARYLVERYGARYFHSTVRREIWRWHVGALRLAARLAEDHLVVLDRHWLSELVYGRIFRGVPAYDVGARCLDRVLRRYRAVTVLCSPIDQEKQVVRWQVGRDAGKREHFDRVREVIATYADLRDGNVAHHGTGYLDQLIKFQDFTARDDVILYDLDRHPTRQYVASFAGRVIKKLNELRLASETSHYPGENLSGRCSARGWLLVGEAVSPRWQHLPRWPWTDDDRQLSAATWLNRALHDTYAREDWLTFTNANDPEDRLPSLLKADWRRVIALGRVAERRVAELGHAAVVVPHPQWHRRFHHGDGWAGYGKILKEAMSA